MVYIREIIHAVRGLRRTPGFTAVAIIVLAVGIAANTVVFSIINAAMLQPLPYPNPERLILLDWYASGNLVSRDISATAFFTLQNQGRSFERVAALSYLEGGVNLSTVGIPQHVRAMRVSMDFFRTLGVQAAIGRTFNAKEDHPGGPAAVVLSYRLWDRQFGHDPLTLGREVRMDGKLVTVVGIMPQGFRFYPETDLWLPLQLSASSADPGNEYRVIARLRHGVRLDDAQQELDHSEQYRLAYPLPSKSDEVRLVAEPLQASMVADIRESLTSLFGAVLFVLLVACTNLAVLLTVRAAARFKEVAIRLALGASRGRLVRMFLLESVLIALAGGISGAILAKETIPLILLLLPSNLPFASSINIDGPVLIFTALTSLLTAFIFGLVPALKMAHTNPNELLRQTTGQVTRGIQHVRLGWILISAQAAVTVVLLSGAGLLLHSFIRLHSVPPGFDSRHLWAAQVWLASERYKTTSATAQFATQLCEKIKNEPGVEAAATVTGLPLERGLNLVLHPGNTPSRTAYAEYRIVSSDYFRTMKIRMISGKEFSSGSVAATPVAIVNQTLAKLWWPDDSALDQYVAVNSTMGGMFSDAPRRIIGTAADVRESGLATPPPPTLYVPVEQIPDSMTAFVNRTFLTSILVRTANGASPAPYVRDALDSADPDLPLASVRSVSEIISASLARPRFYTILIGGFGVLALLLTAIGLYGLLSYQIVLRTREIGVRMAVGAPRSEVVVMILKQGVTFVLLGALLGMAVAPLESRFLATMLYNVRNTTSIVLVSAVLVLGFVAALTSLLSAARAAGIEPAVTLSAE
jgi:putative ABC transport system permease protein